MHRFDDILRGKIKDNRQVLITSGRIFFAGLLFRILFFISFRFIITPDSVGYLGIADNIVAGNFYQDVTETMRQPGYPLFLSIIFLMTGRNLLIVALVQQILSSFTPVIVYLTARQLFDENSAKLSGWLIALNPALAYFGSLILTEANVILLNILATYIFILAIKKELSWLYLVAGVILGFLVWTKTIFIIFIAVFVFVPLLSSKINIKWYQYLLIIGPGILIVFGWFTHNIVKFDEAIYAPTIGLNLFERTVYFNVPENEDPLINVAHENFRKLKNSEFLGSQSDELYWSLAVIDTWRMRVNTTSVPDLDRQFLSIALRQITGAPITYLSTTIREIYYTWAGYTPHWAKWRPTDQENIPDWSYIILGPVLGIIMVILFSVGTIYTVIKRNHLGFLLIFPVILISLATSLIIPSDYRYRLAVEPQIIIIISFAIMTLIANNQKSGVKKIG
jgi:4-amino-4-deoxy-L-arabinose transferase-like glycosyltransferase